MYVCLCILASVLCVYVSESVCVTASQSQTYIYNTSVCVRVNEKMYRYTQHVHCSFPTNWEI